ncbi:MAG: hypothetical protein AAGF99_07335 [Bacteroidota bacterium]
MRRNDGDAVVRLHARVGWRGEHRRIAVGGGADEAEHGGLREARLHLAECEPDHLGVLHDVDLVRGAEREQLGEDLR